MSSKIAVVVYAGTFEKKGDRYVLGYDTAGRCRKALKVTRRMRSATIFLSGGKQPGNPETTHARVMFDWFRAHGFKGDIVMSEIGYVTNSAIETILAARRIGQLGGFERISVVTSWYHMPRVWLLWKLIAKTNVLVVWSDEAENAPWSLMWEFGGFGKLFLNYVQGRYPFNKPVPV